MKLFVCRFAQQWEDFRLPELESVGLIQGVHLEMHRESYTEKVTILYYIIFNIIVYISFLVINTLVCRVHF